VDKKLAWKARERKWERLLVNSGLWLYCTNCVKQDKIPFFITLEQQKSVPQHFVFRVKIVHCVRPEDRTSESKCCVSVDKELAGEARELNRESVDNSGM
jgi:hypothetical protein